MMPINFSGIPMDIEEQYYIEYILNMKISLSHGMINHIPSHKARLDWKTSDLKITIVTTQNFQSHSDAWFCAIHQAFGKLGRNEYY